MRAADKLADFYDRRNALCFGVAALLLILWALFAGRTAGLSDNGDFARVMNASSLEYRTADKAFVYVDEYTIRLTDGSLWDNLTRILFGREGLGAYPSVQIPVVRLSVAANLLWNALTGGDRTIYRLGTLGALYAVLYAAALAFLLAQFRLRRRWADAAAKGAVLFVLCDAGYVTYFNSFYGEALQIILLVFCAGLLLRAVLHPPGKTTAALCAAAPLLLGWVKFFSIPVAGLLVLALEGILFLRTRKKSAVALGAAALLALAAVYAAVPVWMSRETNYNAVFFGVLREADTAEAGRYLTELGLPTELAEFRGTTYYTAGVPQAMTAGGYLPEIMAVPKADLAGFYLRHPDRLLRQAEITVLQCGMVRPYYLANLDAQYPRMTLTPRLSGWSELRVRLDFDGWVGNLGVIAAFVPALWTAMRKRKRREFAAALILWAAALGYCFFVPVISNGEGDLAKHMFLFVQMMDLMFLFVLVRALDAGGRFGLARAGCVLMCACLILPPAAEGAAASAAAERARSGLEPGAYVTLGSYGGKPLVWQVAEADGDGLTLLSRDSVGEGAFSGDGNALWADSGLRRWLNGSFLKEFSAEERALLLKTEHTVLLNAGGKDRAEAGDREFYCLHIPSLADRGYARAYQMKTTDLVRLPDIALVAGMARRGEKIAAGEKYWLDTPYYSASGMVRCVWADGYICFRAAKDAAGVRPVIRIVVPALKSGTGSEADPFVVSGGE